MFGNLIFNFFDTGFVFFICKIVFFNPKILNFNHEYMYGFLSHHFHGLILPYKVLSIFQNSAQILLCCDALYDPISPNGYDNGGRVI
jgi:hypothetical protein